MRYNSVHAANWAGEVIKKARASDDPGVLRVIAAGALVQSIKETGLVAEVVGVAPGGSGRLARALADDPPLIEAARQRRLNMQEIPPSAATKSGDAPGSSNTTGLAMGRLSMSPARTDGMRRVSYQVRAMPSSWSRIARRISAGVPMTTRQCTWGNGQQGHW